MTDCRNFSAVTENVHFLENDTLVVGDTRFLGCILWSDFIMMGDPKDPMELAQQIIYDYKRVKLREREGEERDLTPQDTRERNAESRKFLQGRLSEKFDGTTVVVTHFPPIPMSSPQFADSPLTPYFNNDWTQDIQKGILSPDIWISGHTHFEDETTIGATRIRSPAKADTPVSWGLFSGGSSKLRPDTYRQFRTDN